MNLVENVQNFAEKRLQMMTYIFGSKYGKKKNLQY